ncbi:hypothetical protein [Rhizobium sp. LjRoot258]|uniref:hypothetical protein n=1 Tax=Rhizobium sp. LjRoot258 TaxID=3342299 RepID=UPI003ED0F15F
MKAHIPLVISGRLLSFGFYLATLVPARYIFRYFRLREEHFLVFAVLYLSCPLYVFWSRGIMIETAALFFSVAWFASLLALQKTPTIYTLLLSIALGCLASLTKSTTFLGFGVPVFAFVIYEIVDGYRQKSLHEKIRPFLSLAASGVIALAVGYLWVKYSDLIKIQNPNSAMFTSAALQRWTFGTLHLRESPEFWKIVWGRMPFDVFGCAAFLALFCFGASAKSTRSLLLVLLGLLSFLAAILTFSNLHFVHTYYQTSIAIFLVFSAAISLAAFADVRPKTAIVILTAIFAGNVFYVERFYQPLISNDAMGDELLKVGQVIQNNTSEKQAIVVVGSDWSSEVPFYANRKGFAVKNHTPDPIVVNAINNPESVFGGAKLGAIVDCRSLFNNLNSFAGVAEILKTRPIVYTDEKCTVYK